MGLPMPVYYAVSGSGSTLIYQRKNVKSSSLMDGVIGFSIEQIFT